MDINDIKNHINNKSRLIGVDMGSKRVGLSISDENRKIATPLKTVNYENIQILSDELKKIANEGVTDEELARVKANVIAGDVYEKDSMFYQAMIIGQLETMGYSYKIKDDNNFVKVAARLADELRPTNNNGVIWANQFDNTANAKGHYEGTGQEIWEQTEGKVDGFVCSSGTGGTISGVSNALKEKNKDIKFYLSDPKGSALYNYIKNGELKSEGGSITEGIGSSRVTANFGEAKIDDAYSIDDHEALPILYDLIQNEGLSLGTSCGINIAGAIRMGKELGPGKTIVTILCDRSDKYATKMFNKKFLEEKGLPVPNWF